LEAKARSAQTLDMMVRAVCTPHLDPNDYKSFRQNLSMLASGPGRLVAWEDTLTERQKAGLKKALEAQQRTIEKLKRHGRFGKSGGAVDSRGRELGKRFGRTKKPGA